MIELDNFLIFGRIEVLEPAAPNIDALYGPYSSIEAACTAIPLIRRAKGLTVGIETENGIEEYWWKSGTEDEDLVTKIESIISSAQLIIPEILNYTESPGSINFLVLYSSKIGGRISIYRNGIEVSNLNIVPGLNTYSVIVPEEFTNYVYSIVVKDVFGQQIDLVLDSFTIKVGSIKIITNLLKQLDSEILRESINTYVTVLNSGNPCHLYITNNGVRTQFTGTSFNSYPLNISLNQVSGTYSIVLEAYSLDNGIENAEEYDRVEYTYTRLNENDTPYKIIIDNVGRATTVERAIVSFHYQAFDSVQKRVSFIVDGVETISDTYFASFSLCRYGLNVISLPGNHTLKLKIDDIESEQITFVINLYEIDENIVAGSLFLFDPVQSEFCGNYSLVYSGITEGVNGVDSENNLIKFSGESRATLKYNGEDLNPFNLDLNNGATLELIYNTKCIGNLNAPVLTTFENSTDNNLGVEISYKLILVGLGGAVRHSVDVSENTWIHATIVFSTTGFASDDPNETINGGYMYIYINGCMVLVQPLSQLPTSNPNSRLTLNVDNSLTNFGECDIKVLRFYNKPLSPNEVVQNYINSIEDPEEREKASGRNNLDLPIVTFIEKGDSEYHFDEHLLLLIDKSLQKVQLVKCRTEFRENSTADPIVWEYTTVGTQGTSTLQFPIKNFKVKIYNNDGYKSKKYVSFKSTEGWDEEYVFTLKCDYMESSHLNNTPTCTFFNNLVDQLIEDEEFLDWTYDTVSPSRAGYISSEGDYRTYFDGQTDKRGYLDAIKGFPCVVKYVRNNEEHYLGTFMFNLDKEAKSLGFDTYHKNQNETITESLCVSIEGKSNTDEGAGSFCSFDYWLNNKSGYNSSTGTYSSTDGYYASEYNSYYKNDKNIIDHTKTFSEFIQYYIVDHPGEDFYSESGGMNKRHLISVDNQNSYYNQDFETRYIYDESYESLPDHWHNWINVVDKVSSWYEIAKDKDVTNLQLSEIKTEFLKYFSLNYCLLYYLLMIVFAQVDNAGKNCMWDTWGEDLQESSDESDESIFKWFPRPYDLDTMSGLDNSGLEIIDPDVEYNLEGSPGNWYKSSASLTGAYIYPDINESSLTSRRYYKFNTSGSRLWVLFKILFDSEIKNLYSKLRNSGIYTIENIISSYFGQTSDIIGEKYYNKDSINKYLKLGNNLLDRLHGNRRERFKYWITTRLKFCDSLFDYSITENELLDLRIAPSSVTSLVFKVYNPIYIHIIVGTRTGTELNSDVEYNFYCSPTSEYEEGKEGVKIDIPMTAGDKEVSIFGASSIKEIEGLSNLNCKKINLARAEKITALELINNKELTELNFGNNKYLLLLVAEGLTKVKLTLNLTGASNIKSVSLRGSTFDNLELTTQYSGTTVKTVDVSNTAIRNLTIRQAPFLESLNVNGCSLLNSLILDNCNIENIAFSSLPVLSVLKLINCKYLKTVNISELSYFLLDPENFYNCPELEEIIMEGVYNVGNTKILSLLSITGLETLSLKNSRGIERVSFDTEVLTTLNSLNLLNSELVLLALPPLSELSYLNCKGCVNLTGITGLNLDNTSGTTLNNSGIFLNCKALTSIKGPQLKGNTAEKLFLGCYALEEIDVDEIDFKNSSNFSGTFARCYELPWIEIKKVLDSELPNINASSILSYRYYNPTKSALGEIPADILKKLPHITNLSKAFSYGPDSNNDYVTGHSVPTGYAKINRINTFDSNFDNVTNINYILYGSDILNIPNLYLSKLPNITSAVGAFELCKSLTSIPNNIFLSNTSLVNLNGCFLACNGITSNIGNILEGLNNLQEAIGLFYSSGIRGVVQKGFLKDNISLTKAAGMFASSQITGLNPLFFDNNDTPLTNTTLYDIRGMFDNCTLLKGDIPEDLFTGCENITDTGVTIISTANTYISPKGLFYNTLILNVPQKFFDSISKTTSTQGMFFNCKLATFPTVIIDSETLEYKYEFLKNFLNVTNLNQMFTGCKLLSSSIDENFIPSTATQINGIFAFSDIPNVVSLKNLSGLTSAVGAWANTKVNKLPRDENNKITLFKNLSLLNNVSYFFRGCRNLDDYLDEELFLDCVNLKKTSYMFAYCESLGESGSRSTLSRGLFKNNTLLEDTSYMFDHCLYLNGRIPNIFDTTQDYEESESEGEEEIVLTSRPYLKLSHIDNMFSYTNVDVDEEGYAFEEGLFSNLVNLLSAKFLFAGLNTSGYSVRTSGERMKKPYKLYSIDTLFTSAILSDVLGIFSNSNLSGTIDTNLFRLSLSGLENMLEAFYNTKISSIGNQFLVSKISGVNYKLNNVKNCFRSTSSLTSSIPLCDDKTKFLGFKNDPNKYEGYAYATNASNALSFTGMWISGTSEVSIVNPGAYNKRNDLDTYQASYNNLIGL